MNEFHFKLVKLQGKLAIDFREGPVRLRSGEMLVVPKGVEHRRRAYGARQRQDLTW